MSAVLEPLRILALSGSLRAGSLNRMLIRLAASLAPAGIELIEFEDLAAVGPFDEDAEHLPSAGVTAWRDALRTADAVLIATPEYNSSVPGQLKNALDWASRGESPGGGLASSALYGKPVAVISSSKGQFGGVWAAQELRKILKAQGARVLAGHDFAVPGVADAFLPDGTLRSPDQMARLAAVLEGLAVQVEQLREVRSGAA